MGDKKMKRAESRVTALLVSGSESRAADDGRLRRVGALQERRSLFDLGFGLVLLEHSVSVDSIEPCGFLA